MGWEYLGISDHSKSSFQAQGLYEDSLMELNAQPMQLDMDWREWHKASEN